MNKVIAGFPALLLSCLLVACGGGGGGGGDRDKPSAGDTIATEGNGDGISKTPSSPSFHGPSLDGVTWTITPIGTEFNTPPYIDVGVMAFTDLGEAIGNYIAPDDKANPPAYSSVILTAQGTRQAISRRFESEFIYDINQCHPDCAGHKTGDIETV